MSDLTKNSIEWQMFGDIFQFFKKFYILEDNKEYWQGMEKAMLEIAKKYSDYDCSEMCKDMLLAIMDHYERLAKKKYAKERKKRVG